MGRILLLWIVLGGAFVALWRLEESLRADEVAARDSAFRIGRLIRKDERERIQAAAVSVGPKNGTKWIYARDELGHWVCINFQLALASEEMIDRLMKTLLDAEGTVRTRDLSRASEYGIGTDQSYEVRLHGPEISGPDHLDVRFTVELGKPLEDLNACYVKRTDDAGIWEIDTNPWTALAPGAHAGLPPMLDPNVIPRVWPGQSRRVNVIRVEHADGEAFEITLHDIQITEEEFRLGKSPYEWHLHANGTENIAPMRPTGAYSSYLFFAPFADLPDPRLTKELGFEQPRVRIQLTPADGEVCELRVAPKPLESGLVPVLNLQAQRLYAVTPAVAELLAPRHAAFQGEDGPNPWEAELQKRSQ